MRRSKLVLAAVAAIAILMPGCASFHRIDPYPKGQPPVSVAVTPDTLSKMNDLPVGAYYDSAHRIVVTGHQKGLGVGMLFGVVGVLVADSANKSAGESRFGGDAAKMSTDLVAMTHDLMAEQLAAQPASAISELKERVGTLTVSPYGVFTVAKDGRARLYALLKVELNGPQRDPVWSVRYFARAPGEFPVDGPEGWGKDDRYAAGMRVALGKATAAFLAEMRGELTGTHKVKAKGRYPFVNTDIELRMVLVKEEADTVVARLMVGDAMILAGTQVLDRSDFTFVDTDFKTP